MFRDNIVRYLRCLWFIHDDDVVPMLINKHKIYSLFFSAIFEDLLTPAGLVNQFALSILIQEIHFITFTIQARFGSGSGFSKYSRIRIWFFKSWTTLIWCWPGQIRIGIKSEHQALKLGRKKINVCYIILNLGL